jgi:photosystem II stability/assembly factor-like uncharacterized protein
VFVDTMHGLVLGPGSPPVQLAPLLETTDGGKSFSDANYIGERSQWLDKILTPAPEGNILAVGNEVIIGTANKGATWQLLVTDPGNHSGGWLFPRGHWLVVGRGRGGKIVSTHDFGSNWAVVADLPQPNSLFDVSFSDSDHGCAIGGPQFLLCTSDGGETWVDRETLPKFTGDAPSASTLYLRIVLLRGGMGWILSNGGYLYQTKDGGETWEEMDLLKASSI